MSNSIFIPKTQRTSESAVDHATTNTVASEHAQGPVDGLTAFLLNLSRLAVVALFGLLPIVFVPGLKATLPFDKVMVTLVLAIVCVVSVSFVSLRLQETKTFLPITLLLFWLFVLAAFISGFLSGDIQDSIRGVAFETHTAGFLALMALAMTLPLVLQQSKIMSIRALTLFAIVSGLVLLYAAARLFIGADFLPFDSFREVTATPIGSFNDLAIFAALVVITSIISLLQLPLRFYMQVLVALLVLVALTVLAIINFFKIWAVIGFFGLLTFVYLISRDKLSRASEESRQMSPVPLAATAIVFVVSVVFIVAGATVSNYLSSVVNTNYIEVRPSLTATIEIARSVYDQNILLGTGPNKFADAWRQYKDVAINETVFWNTNFNAGYGFVPSIFVTTGILGGILLLAFHAYYLYLGYRMFLRKVHSDSFWYFIGVISFASSVFLWSMTYIYVPGATILLLAALFTGLTFVAYSGLTPAVNIRIPLASTQQRGFAMMAVVILLVVIMVGSLFTVSKQYVAQVRFTEAVSAATTNDASAKLNDAALLYRDDRFIGTAAQLELSRINQLLATAEPTEENQQAFFDAATAAITTSQEAIALDPTNPDHYATIANVYGNLAIAGVDGALVSAENALARAIELDPKNPSYPLIGAQLSVQLGDVTAAREYIRAALALKRNYTDALFLSAQLDIEAGNTESAITTTRSIITLEPNNPTRYFQLGVLLSANGDTALAIDAFQRAVALDPGYANARYLLALGYLEQDNRAAALRELRIVQTTNQNNEGLLQLIQQIESGEDVSLPGFGFEAPVSETAPAAFDTDAITLPVDPGTDLITPVNQVSGAQDIDQNESDPAVVTEDAVEEAE